MARQVGILKIQGSVDGVTFVTTTDGYIVKKKSNITRRRVQTSAAFARTRETNADFSTAARAGKLLRNSVSTLLRDSADNRVASRLLQAMMAVLKEDSSHTPGSRTITGGKVALLEGFNFNIKANLASIFTAPFTTTINRTTGALSVAIPGFIPAQSLAAPASTTHFQVVSAGVEVNFDEGTYVSSQDDSGLLAWNNTDTEAISLSNTVTLNSTHPLFVMLGVRFYTEVNGVPYALKDAAYNGLTIVRVSDGKVEKV